MQLRGMGRARRAVLARKCGAIDCEILGLRCAIGILRWGEDGLIAFRRAGPQARRQGRIFCAKRQMGKGGVGGGQIAP